MPLTKELQALRLGGIGASEIASVVGLDPHRSAFTLWAEIRGLVEPSEGNEYTKWGDRLEPVLIAAYAEEQHVTVAPAPGTVLHPVHDWMRCTPDALVVGDPLRPWWGLQAKNRNAWLASQWGEPGTDQVPDAVALQAHWSMAVTGYGQWDVAVLLGGWDFRVYRLHSDRQIAMQAFELAEAFWFAHVQRNRAPTPVPADNERLCRLLRQTSEVLKPADGPIDELLERLLVVRAELARVAQEKDGLEAALKVFIGDAAGIESRVAECTWRQTGEGRVVDWQSYAKGCNRPELEPQFTLKRPGVRVFRVSARQEA